MGLYHRPTRRPAPPARPGVLSRPGPVDAPANGTGDDIDLERALWDMEYRRHVLEILRRSRRDAGKPPAPPPPEKQNQGDN